MDIYEFTEALRRQKWILIVGTILIVAFVAYSGFDYENGIQFKAKPRYESAIQIAVVPADLESLAEPLPNPGAMAGTASLYATMLSSPQATVEIMAETGVQLVDALVVSTSGRDGFLGVKATAREPEGARKAVLHSFTWLERELADPLTVVAFEQPGANEVAPSILDKNGRFPGTIRLDASPAFAETATGVWMTLKGPETQATFSLADAALVARQQTATLEPDSEMMISLEDVFGNEIDSATVVVPPLPGPDTVPYVMTLSLDRGALHFPRSPAATAGTEGSGTSALLPDPELVDRHIRVSWAPATPSVPNVDEQVVEPDDVGLLLLTDDPIALVTGSRRGPILVMAALVGGFFALIVLAVSVDSWSRARRSRRAEIEVAAPTELVGVEGMPETNDKARGLG